MTVKVGRAFGRIFRIIYLHLGETERKFGMKIIRIFVFALCGIGSVFGARAATKCVALTSSTTCAASTAIGKLEWDATCTTGSTNVAISGIAGCSSQSGSVYQKSDSIPTSSTSDDNIYCWCKMTNPAVSSWLFADGSIGSAGDCAAYCANVCARSIQSNATFRSALFSGLSD